MMSIKKSGGRKENSFIPASAGSFLLDKSVLILFLFICSIGLLYAKQPASYVVDQVITRLFRNIILVLSLIVPVWAGMGLNFSIVVGAMSAQAGLIIALNYEVMGIAGIVVAFLASVPIAVLLGILTGKLFNRTKGQEMITGMILGYFANGVYQLIFMYLCGTIIPMKNQAIMLNNGLGINGTVTLDQSLSGVVDKLIKLPLDKTLCLCFGICAAYFLIRLTVVHLKHKKSFSLKNILLPVMCIAAIALVKVLVKSSRTLSMTCMFTQVPVATAVIAVMVCLFISFLSNTKLGSDIKTVGRSISIARTAGINVDKIRIISIVISTVIAALGQIVYLQSLGTLTTYSAADQIGTFSVAALLVGGASIREANIGQAILGTVLFHLMFTIAPIAGKNMFGDAAIGEYFRVFVSYAVIALALALHAWKNSAAEKRTGK